MLRKTPKTPRWRSPPGHSPPTPTSTLMPAPVPAAATAAVAVAPIPAPTIPACLPVGMVPISVPLACKTFTVEALLPPRRPRDPGPHRAPRGRSLRVVTQATGAAIPLHSGIPAMQQTPPLVKPTAATPPTLAAMTLIPPIGRPTRISPCLVAHRKTPTTQPRIKTIGAATAAAGIPRTPTRPASATPTMGPADIPPPTIPPRPPIRTMIRLPRCMKLPVLQGRRTPPRTGRRQARRWGIPRPPTPPIPLAVSRTPAVGGSGWPPGRPRARAAGGVVSKANPSRSHRTTGARTGDPNKKPKIRGTGGGVGTKAAG